MKLTYIRDMARNYMVPVCTQKVSEEDYRVCMLTENKIRGLLPCTVKKQNGQTCFYYDITSRQSVAYVYDRGSMGEMEIRELLQGIYYALKEIQKYLLDISMLVLEPDMIYMDIETKQPAFCYLPGYQKDIMESFRELTAYIMEHISRKDEKAVLLGYDIYRKAKEENDSLENLLKFGGEGKEATGWGVETKIGKYETQENQQNSGNLAATWEDPGKRSPAGKGRMQEIEPPNKGTRKPEEMHSKKKQKSLDKKKKKEKPGIKKGILIGAILIPILCAAAFFLWNLDTMQIGGIAFLLTGVLAYGYSSDSKNKKGIKKKEKEEEEFLPEAEEYIPDPGVKHQETEWNPHPGIYHTAYREAYEGGQMVQETHSYFGDTASLPKDGVTEETMALISMGQRKSEPIFLTEEQYVIGKLKTQADIVLDHPSISRIHARIMRKGDVYYLWDMNSTNGTFHNGRRLAVNEHVPLQLGDEIAFARIGFYVERTAFP